MEARDKTGTENLVADHLSRLELLEFDMLQKVHINENFPEEQLLSISWFADIVNYLAPGVLPSDWSSQQKKTFFSVVEHFYLEDPVLYKHCADQLIKRCVYEDEMQAILHHCHSLECGGHYRGSKIAVKVL